MNSRGQTPNINHLHIPETSQCLSIIDTRKKFAYVARILSQAQWPMIATPALGRLKQENCCESETIARSKPIWNTEGDPASEEKEKEVGGEERGGLRNSSVGKVLAL